MAISWGVGNGDDGALTPSAELDPFITRSEKGVLLTCRRPACLRQHSSQPPVTLPGFAASTFARTLVIPWADRSPRCQVMTVGKGTFRTHIRARLRENAGRRDALDSRYRARQFHLLLIRF